MRRPPAGTAARIIGITVCVALGLTLAPAASASFSATSQASTDISTATVPTPTSTNFVFTYVCARNKKTLDVTIAIAEPLPYADAIAVTPAAMPTVLYDISALPQTFTLNTTQIGGNSVTYTFEIQAAYKIPNSAGRLWISQASLLVQHTCT